MNTLKSKKIKIKGKILEIPQKKENETFGEKVYREMLENMKELQEKKDKDLIYFTSDTVCKKSLKMDF